jgi:hypothetical protein
LNSLNDGLKDSDHDEKEEEQTKLNDNFVVFDE